MATRRWVALLRAINLGRRNKVPMSELRAVFAGAGCGSGRTYIQSGNVVFEHAAPDRAVLEHAFAQAFGFETVVVLRSSHQLRRLVAARPLGDATPQSSVVFLADDPGRARLRALAALDVVPDRLAVVGSDVVLLYAHGFHRARLTLDRLERHTGVAGTLRNWRTVERLADLVAE